MKPVLSLFIANLVILSFQIVSAMEISSYKITATPVNGNYVENIIELTIKNDKEIPLINGTFTLAKDAEVINIADSYGAVQYTTETDIENQKLMFTFTIPVQSNETRVLTLQTKTYNIVLKQGYFEYLLVVVPSKTIPSFVHILKLDKEVQLYSAEKDYIIIPDAIVTETDRNIIIEWDTQLEKQHPGVFLVRFYQETGIDYWKWGSIFFITLCIGVIVGIASSKGYVYYKQQKALKATNILNEREKAVLKCIIKSPEIKQYEVIKLLGYTKSNMSKIVKRLELRNLIEVKKEGKVRILNIGQKLKKQ